MFFTKRLGLKSEQCNMLIVVFCVWLIVTILIVIGAVALAFTTKLPLAILIISVVTVSSITGYGLKKRLQVIALQKSKETTQRPMEKSGPAEKGATLKHNGKPDKRLLLRRQHKKPALIQALEHPGYVKPSDITIRKGGMSDDELRRVIYDEPHHWWTVVMTFTNPMWLADSDVQPESAPVSEGKLDNWLDRIVDSYLRVFVGFMRRYLLLSSLLSVAVLVFFTQSVAGNSALEKVLPAVLTSATFWGSVLITNMTIISLWGWYVIRLTHQCRLVVTDWSFRIVIDQLPFRHANVAPLPGDIFTQSSLVRTITAKLFGFGHFIIRSTEDDEPIPFWSYARDWKRLAYIMTWWREGNQQRAGSARRYGQIGLQHTQPTDITKEV